GGHDHTGMRHPLERPKLGFAEAGGAAVVIRVSPRRDLNEVKRHVGVVEPIAPVLNHRGKETLVLFGAPDVRLSLIPDRSANGKRMKRRDHRVVERRWMRGMNLLNAAGC